MIYIDDSEPEGVLEPAFPYRDVTINRGIDAHELYEILSEVGRGKFGTVYRCQEKTSGLKLAAKFVPIPKREDRRNVEREVEIMNSLQHHLIIQLYAAYEYQKMMCVVLELIEGGELFDRVIDDEFVLTERVCVVFIRQVCEAMEFIHRNNILHLDLKPENILCLTQEGNRIKIIDFGLARKFDPDKRLQILFGTPEFVAPEVVNFDCISYGTDMWSVGVICYVLISGLSPFMGETDIETMANVTIAKYDFEDESFGNVSPECLDFIAKLLVKDLDVRMTAAQCLQHKWLQRRPKPATTTPIISPKPTSAPPPKLTPSPVPPQAANEADGEEDDEDDDDDGEDEDEEEEGVVEPKELETTKDNLKNFIERWEEHPNSPYVFDVEANVITPISETPFKTPHGVDSISSSRVGSPSPCESIDTVTDDDATGEDVATPINESREKLFPGGCSGAATPTPTPTPSSQHPFGSQLGDLCGFGGLGGVGAGSSAASPGLNLQQRSLKSYLHTFDRRNSDTNYLLGRRSSGERVNLAEEIRKLSDHLLMLAEINTKLGNEAAESGSDADNNKNSGKEAKSSASPKLAAKASGHSSVSTRPASKATTSSSVSSTSASRSSSSITSKSTSSTTSLKTSSLALNKTQTQTQSKTHSLSQRLQQSIEETPKILANGGLGSGTSWHPAFGKKSTVSTMTTTNTRTSTQAANTCSTASASTFASASESASNRRAKFRINQMSRDVPIGLPDTHQTVNLEEAANTTKDCLLHLLEKYNETKARNPLARHQSISVDWNMSDNLEYRSMSSINAFFQRHNNNGEHVRQLQAQLEGKSAGKNGGL